GSLPRGSRRGAASNARGPRSYQLANDAVGFAPLEVAGERHVQAVEDGSPEVAKADVFLHEMPLVADAQARAARQHRRQVMVVVGVDGAAATAVGDEGVVEQRAVPFADGLELAQE